MREMKDSGVPWIGEIPKVWGRTTLYNVLRGRITDGPHETPTLIDEGIPFISIDSLGRGDQIDFSVVKKFISEEDYRRYSKKTVLENGDILFTKAATIGKTAIVRDKVRFMVWSPLAIIKVDETKASNRFIYFLLNCEQLVTSVKLIGSMNTQINVGMRELEKTQITIPPLNEQQRIADFLDAKCAEIDSIQEKTRASIEDYKKLKQSIITEAVTKGIRGERPMKDSGVEWIGEIPKVWSCKKIKHCFSLRDERNYLPMDNVVLLSLYTDIGVFPHGEHEERGNKAVTVEGYKIVHKNDIVVNIILAWMGAIGISEYDGVTSPAYDVWMPRASIAPRYFHYLFRTPGIAAECYKYGRGIMLMRWRTYSDEFKQISIPNPPIEEQQEIAAYLDEKCATIDSLIASKESLITELESYKKSVIYEYVTGKKEVPAV